MTATIHKLSAGDGYEYYARQVAAHDDTHRGTGFLADYYSSKGESPGVWIGSGLAALGGVRAGDRVTEAQMKAMFGEGRHPDADRIENDVRLAEISRGAKPKDAARAALAATKLGAQYRIYSDSSPYRKRCAEAYAAFNSARGDPARTALPDAQRAAIRTRVAQEMFADEYGRSPLDARELSGWVAKNSRDATTAVAGFDFTFSPPKSVSTLWAVAPRALSEKIAKAHDAAVADAIDYLERHHAYTRVGRHGCRQVDVRGVIATAFVHRDSRAGDPDLHTHVVISNKVQALYGRWYSLDGRMLYRGAVTVSEVYNTRLKMHLKALLGLEFQDVANPDTSKRPTREIVGVDARLNARWSRRRAEIQVRLGELATDFHHHHGREPTPIELLSLAQQATLETRDRKHTLRSHGQQRRIWWDEAVAVLGSPQQATAMIHTAFHPQPIAPDAVDAAWIGDAADAVITTVSGDRATWAHTHVRSEAERHVRGRVPRHRWAAVTAAVVATALAPPRSAALPEPDRMSTPSLLRRRDGSVYTAAGSRRYTSAKILRAERRLVGFARREGARTLPDKTVANAIGAYARTHPGRGLNAGQAALVTEFATSTKRFAIAIAPAGTGKTTAMQVLADSWTTHGGTVVGLAPTGAAASVLGEEIGTAAYTIDSLTHTLERILAGDCPTVPRWILDIGPEHLVVIDEIANSGTVKLDLALSYLVHRGATIRGIGDDAQLGSVASGGVVRDIAEVCGASTITQVMRFRGHPAEGPASLALRAGDPVGLGFYLDHHRIHSGTAATVADDAYTAWRADIGAGRDAILLAPTREAVRTLNDRARTERLATLTHPVGPHVALCDGLSASVGDLIITRRNNPWLRLGATDSVRNGYRWTVTAVQPDGSLDVTHTRTRRQIGLPADYVAQHVNLGYAATIATAQGITADTCHGVLTGTEDRAVLYVLLTRGRFTNHVYLVTATDTTEHSPSSHEALHPATAVDRLTAILARDGRALSATSSHRAAFDPGTRLADAVDAYTDSIGVVAEHLAGEQTLARIDNAAEHVRPDLTDAPAWPVLRAHLATLAVQGHDPVAALHAAAAKRELDTADDPAAVLDWRLDPTGRHTTGHTNPPLPWLPDIPTALLRDPVYGPYLHTRRTLITDLAARVADHARRTTPKARPGWTSPLLHADAELLADLAVWRSACRIDDIDHRPTGPLLSYPIAESLYQRDLIHRVTAALGAQPARRWSASAERLHPRIITDPYWPTVAHLLDHAHHGGTDVDAALAHAHQQGPLPDELPAAALYWRIAHLLPSDAGHAPSHHPEWMSSLADLVGTPLADQIKTAPAWPRIVRAIQDADPAIWTPHTLLATAYHLLTESQIAPEDTLQPDELATTLARRIETLHANTPTRSERDIPPQHHDPDADEEAAARADIPHPDRPYPPEDHAPPDAEQAWTSTPAPPSEPDEDYIAALLADEPPTDERPDDITAADMTRQALARARSHPRRYPDLPLDQQATRLRAEVDNVQDRIDAILAAIAADNPLHHTGITDPDALKLRARADAQRPYRLAWLDAQQDLLQAEVQAAIDHARYRELVEELDHNTQDDPIAADLEQLLAQSPDPTIRAEFADALTALREQPANIGEQLELHLARIAANSSATRAADSRATHDAARQALIDAATGPNQVVEETDVGLAHLNALSHLHDQLTDARHELKQTRRELFWVKLLQDDEETEPLRRLTHAELRNLIDDLQRRVEIAAPPPQTGDTDSTALISIALTPQSDTAQLRRELDDARNEQHRRSTLTPHQLEQEDALRSRFPDSSPTRSDGNASGPDSPDPHGSEPDF